MKVSKGCFRHFQKWIFIKHDAVSHPAAQTTATALLLPSTMDNFAGSEDWKVYILLQTGVVLKIFAIAINESHKNAYFYTHFNLPARTGQLILFVWLQKEAN